MFSEIKFEADCKEGRFKYPSSLNACGLPLRFREEKMNKPRHDYQGQEELAWIIDKCNDRIREQQEIRQSRQAEMVGTR